MLYEKRKQLDSKLKRFQMTKLLKKPKQFARPHPMFKALSSPFHTVMGQAYHKSKNGRVKFCGEIVRN